MNILSILLCFSSFIYKVLGIACGVDKSTVSHVYVGQAPIETYPWLGTLYYPFHKKRFTTAVVLITRQMVLGAASEIDKMPKSDFRARARVIIGHNCSGPHIGVRDYTYHPDYSRNTFSALAMIQLETDHLTLELRPICPPPPYFKDDNFYALVPSDNCKKLKVGIHMMNYVSLEECKSYYRRTGLDIDTMWPSHTACARSSMGGRCVWRSGAILAVKKDNRWRLLGFGVYGPGCEAPARFLDYGMYHSWVLRSIRRIGSPAITTLASNHIVLRRTKSNLQRFGPCDHEESKRELYTDNTYITKTSGTVRVNVTLIGNIDYTCMIMQAHSEKKSEGTRKPQLRLRRWCSGRTGGNHCFGFGFMEIQFYVEITFDGAVNFNLYAYGKPGRVIDPIAAMKYLNTKRRPPKLDSYHETRVKYATHGWKVNNMVSHYLTETEDKDNVDYSEF